MLHIRGNQSGFAQDRTSQPNIVILPYLDPRNLSTCVGLSLISGYRIAVITQDDKSSCDGYVTLYYTKN